MSEPAFTLPICSKAHCRRPAEHYIEIATIDGERQPTLYFCTPDLEAVVSTLELLTANHA